MNTPARYAILIAATACVLPVCVSRAATESQDFSRYQVIIDRAPFGVTTGPGPVPDAQPPFSARFTFVGLVKTEGDGMLRAIVQDKERNRSYFVAENETIPNDTVKIVRIEHSPSKIVLQQGLETATLSYQAGGAVAAPSPAVGTPQQPGQPSAPVSGRRRIPFQRGGN